MSTIPQTAPKLNYRSPWEVIARGTRFDGARFTFGFGDERLGVGTTRCGWWGNGEWLGATDDEALAVVNPSWVEPVRPEVAESDDDSESVICSDCSGSGCHWCGNTGERAGKASDDFEEPDDEFFAPDEEG